MKKLCIALSLILLLAGCASQQPTPTSAPSPDDTSDVVVLTGNVFLDAEEQSHATGFTAKPFRYTVTVNKADALAATAEEYVDFLAQRVEVVKEKGTAESYTMKFEDGTGVIYYGANPISAEYGRVEETGSIIEAYGCIMPEGDGVYSYVSFDEEDDATVKGLLENIYNIDGMKTVVSVADGEAEVWLCADLTIPTEADKETLVASFQGLYDTAKNTVATSLSAQGINKTYVLSASLCSSSNIPLYCIEDGEVAFDMLTVG